MPADLPTKLAGLAAGATPVATASTATATPWLLLIDTDGPASDAESGLRPAAVRRMVLPDGTGDYASALRELAATGLAAGGCKAVVISPARRGTAAALRHLRPDFPELAWYAINPEDSLLEIEAEVDLILSGDPVASAWQAVWVARALANNRLATLAATAVPPDSLQFVQQRSLARIAADLGVHLESILLPMEDAAAQTGQPAAVVWLARQRVAMTAVGWAGRDQVRPFGQTVAVADRPDNDGSQPPWLALFALDSLSWPVAQALAAEPVFLQVENPLVPTGQAVAPAASPPGQPSDCQVRRLAGPAVPSSVALETVLVQLALTRTGAGSATPTPAPVPDQLAVQQQLELSFPGVAWYTDYMFDAGTGVRSRIHITVWQELYLAGATSLPFSRLVPPVRYRR
ncbi:MAG: hypothetical protein A2004_05155 [Spirochaetes bacterium GWC1_61_12]|nr:MAG: hypothetical protein A2004_05155 [Spirochaetes bacterium GWC1_61_12]OHD44919.1 MAG: hypothetical protein A2Y35_12800 [Spirochaetes bacterium GWE1_60_18]OHD60030.1 MAG: hypothetical protein A2Y32_10910 [Spirochaetes bacterium GWF1_60_12]HBO41500.1 hypothetical protein [Spirochaetaceae bacterium]HCQ87972.1 hypothetical protein [Spirochaetaceae bacterium]